MATFASRSTARPTWHCAHIHIYINTHTHTHTHTRLTAFFPGLPRWAGTRKVQPIWILLKQETVSGSGISWNICKSAPRSRQITTPAPHHSVFTGRMPFLPPNQQRQSTEDNCLETYFCHIMFLQNSTISALTDSSHLSEQTICV